MNIKDIKNWFEIAIPEPTTEKACVQIGVHIEEFAEMLWAINEHDESRCADELANKFKSCQNMQLISSAEISHNKRVELLDSLCDQIVTAIGVAHMLGMDIDGALEEVNRSNHSKFVDGKAVFNDQGKITKGEFYSSPELDKFIGSK